MPAITTVGQAAELKINEKLPIGESSVAVLARALIDPANNILLKATKDGIRDKDGLDPFKRKRPSVLIDNENSITLTSDQSGALVLAKYGIPTVGDVYLPADPEDGDYFTLKTRGAGAINIYVNGHLIAGYDGTVSDMPSTSLQAGAVTLVFCEDDGMWHITHVNGTYTFNSGA